MTFSSLPHVAVWEKERARVDAKEPPPNWQSPPKRHHYVPEMYRGSRRDRAQRRRRAYSIEPKALRGLGIVIGVHDAAVETDFYTIETDDSRRVQERDGQPALMIIVGIDRSVEVFVEGDGAAPAADGRKR